MSIVEQMKLLGKNARRAGQEMGAVSSACKNAALVRMAVLIGERKEAIALANEKDLAFALEKGLSGAKVDRLRLTEKRLQEMGEGLREVARLPDPVGEVTKMWTRPNGLRVGRMRIPLGVIGIIYESRPNVTVEASALCMKAGNAVILRGGSEAIHSNRVLAALFQEALVDEGVPKECVQLVQTTERDAVNALLRLDEHIDVMIPRGGESLIRFVAKNARMPVLKHYKGVCHVYVDEGADTKKALAISVNAKTQRPGVCNAMETLLVHEAERGRFLPLLNKELKEAGVSLVGCERTCAQINCPQATEEDWAEEYLDLTLSIKIVASLDEAMDHIAHYGSGHTEAIVTNDYARSQRFLREVQSSLVLINASTRFNDGFELGLGAEIGISTSRLHAFGPMGLEELTTTKFIAYGDGQIRT